MILPPMLARWRPAPADGLARNAALLAAALDRVGWGFMEWGSDMDAWRWQTQNDPGTVR